MTRTHGDGGVHMIDIATTSTHAHAKRRTTAGKTQNVPRQPVLSSRRRSAQHREQSSSKALSRWEAGGGGCSDGGRSYEEELMRAGGPGYLLFQSSAAVSREGSGTGPIIDAGRWSGTYAGVFYRFHSRARMIYGSAVVGGAATRTHTANGCNAS